MADSITKVTRTSWLQRMKNSVGGILFGLLLIVIAVLILFKNEGRAVRTAKGLKEGSSVVLSLTEPKHDMQNEGKLVHLYGTPLVKGTLSDGEFNINVPAIHYKRNVEMYQWVENTETKKEIKTGGAEEITTTYTYTKDWRSDLVDASSFQESAGHNNPSSFPYEEAHMSASEVLLGDFNLSQSLIDRLGHYTPITPGEKNIENVKRAVLNGQNIFIGKGKPSSPEIGDVKISFSQVVPEEISVVARQVNRNLVPYLTTKKTRIELLEYGVVAADVMFANAQRSNRILTWILRLLGFFMIFFGFKLIFAPLGVLVSVLPFLGRIANFGTGLVAFLLALAIALVTIAIGWIVYRPVLGILLLVVAGAALFGIPFLKKKREPEAGAA